MEYGRVTFLVRDFLSVEPEIGTVDWLPNDFDLTHNGFDVSLLGCVNVFHSYFLLSLHFVVAILPSRKGGLLTGFSFPD